MGSLPTWGAYLGVLGLHEELGGGTEQCCLPLPPGACADLAAAKVCHLPADTHSACCL